ncbi:hypothetical protein [Microbacterium sp.]|uniref:hypothetical protein n=1 Tax=Microbacterium sp. TaxID=51671 RepID=UPI0039E36B67
MSDSRILRALLLVAIIVTGVLLPAQAAPAAVTTSVGVNGSLAQSRVVKTSLAGFDAGNLISDEVFTNRDSMTEAQIQTFFNSKVSRCLGGTDEDGRAIVCLKDFTITSASRPADTYCDGYSGAANESAARIIYRVAQSCGINPQVLIVMLQKEQGLVTHTWPSAWRYDIALGQGCPDDASCNPDYVGFFQQIYGAARQMKIYLEGRYFTYYAPGKTWSIRYNPNSSCGSAPVFVANAATSALYYYTPYQPNAAALKAGYGGGDACSAYGNRNFYNYFTDWFGPTRGTTSNPFGNVEIVEAQPGGFRVSGWVADRDTTGSLAVHVYVGSVGTAIKTTVSRPDVEAAYPGVGTTRGFDAVIPATGGGTVKVCIYAINVGAGENALIACKSLTALSGSPVGRLDTITAKAESVAITGWAIDPDTTSSIPLRVYVDSTFSVQLSSDAARTDLVAHYPGYGAAHGYNATVKVPAGDHTICIYAVNTGPGTSTGLACKRLLIPANGDGGKTPIGYLDSVVVSGRTALISGWAIDPDIASSIPVHIYVGSQGAAYAADEVRTDVKKVYPVYGDKHGFAEKVALPEGRNNVCVYAINDGKGGNPLLGCKVVTVGGNDPIGVLDSVTAKKGGISVAGWAYDRDSAASISVHVYVDGKAAAAVTADQGRPDVAAAIAGAGAYRGFTASVSASAGAHRVCVYAINDGSGTNPLLACRDVTVK